MPLEAIEEKLKRFFGPQYYVNKGKNHKELTPKRYWDDLNYLSAIYPDEKCLWVEFRHIETFDKEVSDFLLNNPDEWLQAATDAISELDFAVHKLPDIRIRVFGLPSDLEVGISKLRDIHMDTFLAIRCIVSKASEVRPAFEKAAFLCQRCGYITIVDQAKDSDTLLEPFAGCENDSCGKKGPFKRVKEGAVTYNHQYLKIQEPLETLRGKQPEFLNVSCSDEIAGIVNAGDKLVITGVLKGRPKTNKDGKLKFLEFIFVANSIEKSDADYENMEIQQDDIEYYKDLSRRGILKDYILGSIAPSIFGLEDVKLGIALQLFGGRPVIMPDGTRKRGDIHILMVGDPGVAKSQLLEFVANFAPRAISFSGKSTSAAGLTGAAVKDELDGKWWIQPGALTLADGGICCADEVEKMKAETLGSIHEALEQQMVHIQKAVKADLWTRTAFLGAANPKYGRYDNYAPIYEQVAHGDAFISRMDLLFVLKDKPNQTFDRKLAKHILQTLRGNNTTTEPKMDLEHFRKCIAYARTNVFPELTDESEEMIIDFFVKTRLSTEGKSDTVPITARTLEAAFRLATAHARMRLSETITEEDAKNAVELLLRNLKEVGVDPETGLMDADIIAAGKSNSQSKKIRDICKIIRDLSESEFSKNRSARYEDILERCSEKKINGAEEIIRKMAEAGDLLRPERGYYKLIT